MYNVICTGNPNCPGIAQAVNGLFNNVHFVSRTTGYDLSATDGRIKFQQTIKNFNVFINNSQVVPGTQAVLLNIAKNEWDSGYVFNIGSIAEYSQWEWFDPAYTDEKRKLKELSISLCSENFKTTHMTVGGFKDMENNDQSRMDPLEIANTIKWILDSNFHVPVIGIEKVVDTKVAAWMLRKTE